MTQSIKAAWIALAIISVLTGIKFLLYWLSGSMAVLSEAWHSIADIATTMFVLFSIYRQHRKNTALADPVPEPLEQDADSTPPSRIKRFFRWCHGINTELKIAVVIGCILNVAAILIFIQALFRSPEKVSAPLTTGLIFIGLSFGSFFLSRFEEHIGDQEESAALKADSHHNRADMTISLITGISLILYHFAIDLDRWLAVLIAVYIFTFAAELLVNSCSSIFRGHEKMELRYRFTSIAGRALQLSTYAAFFSQIDARVKLGKKTRKILHTLPCILRWLCRWSLRATAAGLVLAYLSTCLYSIQAGEQALVFRFGRLINDAAPLGPGLHLKFPYPVDSVVRYQAGRVNSLVVGNTMADEPAMIWTTEHGDNRMFISGDNNLFLPYVVIHYRLQNIHSHYSNLVAGGGERVLASLALQLLNHRFSSSSFFDLILSARAEWTETLKKDLQQQCNQFGLGMEIVDFCLRDLHPPIELTRAYEEVVAAHQLKDAELNTAARKVNALLTRERIDSQATIADAEGYVHEKKKVAEGEAANYLLRYTGYEEGGEVLKNILLLKSAEGALAGKKIILVDPESGVTDKFLYIENYMSRNKK